jgi:hypothetical protein
MNQTTFYLRVQSGLIRLFVLVSLFFQPAAVSSVQAEQLQGQNNDSVLPASIGGCPLFPDNNIWNTPINNLPVHPRSDQWLNSIGRNTGFHMDFGSGTWAGGPIGIPYNVVGAGVPKVLVSFNYPDESDPGPYPIPANPKIEHGSDRHLLIVDSSTCKLYEIFDASYSGGSWSAGSGAIWDLNSNALRPDTWTSADAAGLPILPGLVRYDEILSGTIDHAIRFTASNTNGYIWPARHLTSNDPNTPNIPPMGARFRLKASFNVSAYPAHMRVILNAMKTYGIILADNGSDWYVSGAPDPRWNNDMLHLLDDLTGNDFEAVNTSVLMVNYNSGATGATISGNAGFAGVKLSYTDGSAKTVTTAANGNYSFPISYNWSGTVTASHPCFTFSPPDRSYSSVTANQTAQDYAASLDPGASCADAAVRIRGVPRGRYGLLPGAITRASYAGLDTGPVEIVSNNTVPIFGAERVFYKVNGAKRSFSELMALPASQLDITYWLPWYNNKTLDTQLRIANVTDTEANIHISIGDMDMGAFPLAGGTSIRKSFAGIDKGPVKIASDADDVRIVVSERVIYKVNTAHASFSEMMALPANQVDNVYWLPWYNSKTMDTQLRIGNVSGAEASVNVSIGGAEVTGSPFSIPVGTSKRLTFPKIDKGPVKIESNVDIVAAERVYYKSTGGTLLSYSETMALPEKGLDTVYWLPWYNSKTLDSQIRIGNVSGADASVHVYVGGTEVTGSPFDIPMGTSQRLTFYNLDQGPVKIESNVDVVVSERVIYKVNNVPTSFSEMMGFPNSVLDTTFWLPWYNNKHMGTQLRFGVP